MMSWPPKTWGEVRADPNFDKLSPDAQNKLRGDWAQDRFNASRSTNPAELKRFMEEAHSDIPSQSFLGKAVGVGGEVLGRASRILNTPQQVLAGIWKKGEAGWGPPP